MHDLNNAHQGAGLAGVAMMPNQWVLTSPAEELIKATTAFNAAVRKARDAGWSVSVSTEPPADQQVASDATVFVHVSRTHF